MKDVNFVECKCSLVQKMLSGLLYLLLNFCKFTLACYFIPALQDVHFQFCSHYQESHDAYRTLMWTKFKTSYKKKYFWIKKLYKDTNIWKIYGFHIVFDQGLKPFFFSVNFFVFNFGFHSLKINWKVGEGQL